MPKAREKISATRKLRSQRRADCVAVHYAAASPCSLDAKSESEVDTDDECPDLCDINSDCDAGGLEDGPRQPRKRARGSPAVPLTSPAGVQGKRARTRLRRSRNQRKVVDPIVGGSQSLKMAANGWIQVQDGMWPTILPKSKDVSLDEFSVAVGKLTQDELRIDLEHYEEFHELPPESATAEMVHSSSAGIAGWLECDPRKPVRVGNQVYSEKLCGLWLKQSLMAASEMPEWERVVLTVDSGASDTVVPPSIARHLPLINSGKVGIEYEIANGGVVVNLRERRAEVSIKLRHENTFLMSFQVVDVHKPLLAVSKFVSAGHKVIFDTDSPHILFSNGEKVNMRCSGGTYEIEVWIKNPGFTRPTAR